MPRPQARYSAGPIEPLPATRHLIANLTTDPRSPKAGSADGRLARDGFKFAGGDCRMRIAAICVRAKSTERRIAMFRFLFRLMATFALAVAVIMAVLDVTRTIAASRLVLTPLGDELARRVADDARHGAALRHRKRRIRWSGIRSWSSSSASRASRFSACSPSCSTPSATGRERRHRPLRRRPR